MTKKQLRSLSQGTGAVLREPLLFQKKRDIFCAAGINDGDPTSEIGKLAVLTPAHGTLWQHAEHTEGSDTTPTSYTQKALSAGRASCNFDKSKKDHATQRGRDACGTATRLCASLFRRLSVSFRSASDQDLKAAKYVVLIPGPGMFVNVRNAPRVVIAPHLKQPLFRPVSRCVRSFEQRRVCTRFRERKRMWAICERS